MTRLLVSFSGGETSALMTKLVMDHWKSKYDEIKIVFANTGEENEETLIFVDQCAGQFGWDVVWIEGVVGNAGTGGKSKIVSFETANRDGQPFEDVIEKYGLPGPGFLHCTRELKANPIKAYARSIGWEFGSYDTAIGIRIDEIDRMSVNAEKNRLIYPMINPWPLRKIDVNEFWCRQNFRLNLRGYQGNCKWCWKKSLRKLVTIARENPEHFDFPARMEAMHGTPDRQLFRGRMIVPDILALRSDPKISNAHDDSRSYQTDIFTDPALDVGSGCDDSCEVDFDDIDGPSGEGRG